MVLGSLAVDAPQWWSPVHLGNSYSQQSELVRYTKGKITCAESGSADEIHRVVQNWAA